MATTKSLFSMVIVVSLSMMVAVVAPTHAQSPLRTPASRLSLLSLAHSLTATSLSWIASLFRGATFPQFLYQSWASAYSNSVDARVNITYIGEGSGLGQSAILVAHSVQYAASDSPLSMAQYVSVPDAQVPKRAARCRPHAGVLVGSVRLI